MGLRGPASVNEIRTAIRELSVRAELAHKEGREQDAAEIEHRIQAYRDELAERP
jgi:phage shock protein A